jgi:alkanesulfonate monooxygenase SsuD/methylene tetrahydromethanopterin reductase-like flavin-dependent oxidoreductase (luciferase family)
MKFTLFHLMPYAALDLEAAKHYPSTWLHTPNTLYDPKIGADLYERFDAIAVNEHHSTAYGLMPSPIVTASALARRTKKVNIAILGSALPLRDHPLTLAEEHAMIDCITRGRLITGMVRGIGAEYHVWGVNPAFSHERFHEAHDLILQAWTKPGVTRFQGKHYHHEYVNIWPRPYRQPHPPIWIPSQGSRETIDWASHPDRRYVYLQTFSPLKAVQKYLQMYRERCTAYGYTCPDEQLGWATPVYVAETDAAARREAKPHYEAFRNKFARLPFELLFPPGYSSIESMKNVSAVKGHLGADLTLEACMDLGIVVCGSVETVVQRLTEAWRDLRFGHLLTLLQFGTLPADLTAKNMTLFAEKVMPRLRDLSERDPAA